MLSTSERLLRVLTLLESSRDWSGADLAERLEVSTRTIRNDMVRLRTLGYPVGAASGVAGGYRLGAGAALPPLLLDDDEAVAVAVALRSSTGGLAGIEETSVRALSAYTVPVAFPGPTVEPHLLSTIAAACRDAEVLRMDYRKHDGTESTRSVEPYRLVHLGRRWYLVAWDRDRRAWRTFRVDRLQVRSPNGPRFTPREPPAEDIGDYVMRNVRSVPMTYHARAVVRAPAAVITERVPRGIVVEPIDDETCAVHGTANTIEMLALYLGMLDADFTVTDPPELIAHLNKLSERFLGAVSPSPARAGEGRGKG